MAKKAAPKASTPAKRKSPRPTPPQSRVPWLDEKTNAPLIADYAQQMTTFVKAMADGVIEDHEIAEQEASVVQLMQEIEPLLSDELHRKVTQLLCEVAVYDLMQMMQALQQQRMATTFRG